MKLNICIFSQFFVCCLSDIFTEYRYIQQYGFVTYSDIQRCQLQANGNMSCAIRIDTKLSNGFFEERERCEELDVDWCISGTMDPLYTYVGKSAVVYTPPFVFHNYDTDKWKILEDIPIAIKQDAQLSIQFTAVGTWNEIQIGFLNSVGTVLHQKSFGPSNPVYSNVVTTVTAVFDAHEIRLYLQGQFYVSTGHLGTSVANIRVLKFVFVGNKGNIHRVSYRA